MNPTLAQLSEQFSRLAPLPAPVVAAPVAATPSPVSAATPASVAAPGTPVAPPSPAAPPPPPPPVQSTDFALKGYHLDVTVAPEQVVAAAQIANEAGFALDAVTGVDWIAQNQMEVVYDYLHFASPLRVVVRTRVPRAQPEVTTISSVYPGANWHERETHDFFGIRFAGHPNLKPFLLPEDADFHPLRKDYKP